MNVEQFRFTGGLPETACGFGSKLETTAHLRSVLPDLFVRMAINSVLDAPCGDFNWMAETDLSDIDYIGCDIDTDHLEVARVKAGEMLPENRPRSLRFIELDVVRNFLPVADVMICRDFLQHFPTVQVLTIIRNFFESQIPWLLATSYGNAVNEDIERAGMFREFNLNVAPFGLPEPVVAIPDPPDSGRILGLWSRKAFTGGLG